MMNPILHTFTTRTNRLLTGNHCRLTFLFLLWLIHAGLTAQSFQVVGGIPYFPAYASAASVSLSPIPTGVVIYDISKAQLQLYNGSAWESLCSIDIPSTSNASTAFRIVKGIPVLSVTSLGTPAAAGATYLNTAGTIYVGDGSAWNTLDKYMRKANVIPTSPTRMGAVAGTGSALVIPVLTAAPTGVTAGAAYFDAVSANLKVYDGVSWLTVSCVPPVAFNVATGGTFAPNGSVTGTSSCSQADGLACGTSLYQWYYATSPSDSYKTPFYQTGATTQNFNIPTSGYAGKYMAFGVTPVTVTGLVGSPLLSTWKQVNYDAPVASSVSVSGPFVYSGSLTGYYNFIQAQGLTEGTSTYQWYYATSAAGANQTAIPGSTLRNYNLPAGYGGTYIAFGVIPVANITTLPATQALSYWTQVTNTLPAAYNVIANGSFVANGSLSGSYGYTSGDGRGEGTSVYQWYLGTSTYDSNPTAIWGATSSSYTLPAGNEGKYIFFGVKPVTVSGKSGSTSLGNQYYKSSGHLVDYPVPSVSNVHASGSFALNGTISGTCDFNPTGIDGTSLYQWYAADDANGTNKQAISGVTSKSCTMPVGYGGQYIAFGVIPVNHGKSGAPGLSEWHQVTWACGDNLNVIHSTATGAPYNAHISYETVHIGVTNSCWIIRDLGASKKATGPYDNSDEGTGWFWQFGQRAGVDHSGKPSANWATTTPAGDWSDANDPCTLQLGAGWKLPTKEQWTAVRSTYYSNEEMYLYSGIFTHGAGYIEPQTTRIFADGSTGYYWTKNGRIDNKYAYNMFQNWFNAGPTDIREVSCAETIRCTK